VIAYALARDEHNPQNRAPKVDFPWSRETDTVFRLHTCSNTPALTFDNADPSGRWLYSCSIDGRTFKWDLHTRALAAVYQMGWCASAASPSTTPGFGGPGSTCACEGAGTILHGAWGAIPLDTRAAHKMTYTEESNLDPVTDKPCFRDMSAHTRRFTAQKRYGPTGVYASTSDDGKPPYLKIMHLEASPAFSNEDYPVRLPK
jgi:hypothetical protein